jgi:hypothetical protein
MRHIKKLLIFGVLGIVFSAAAFAQGPALDNAPRSVPVTKTIYSDDQFYFVQSDAASSAESAKPKDAAEPASSDCADCAGCSSENKPQCECCFGLSIFKCNLGDAWTMPQLCALSQRGIKTSGWIEAGIYGNQYDAGTNGPLGVLDQKHLNLNQLWFIAERATDTEKHDFDIGGRVDYMFGIDGPDTQCFGDHSFDWNWTSSYAHNGAALYGSAMPQLYGEVAYKDVKMKIGHFYTPMGNEVFPATGNFFYSHSYMFYYAEPFTHTGVLATKKISDKLSGSAGWANGWDCGFGDFNHGSLFLGGLAYTPNDKATLAWYMCSGYWGTGDAYPGAATNDIFMNSLVLTYKLTEKWTYILQHDYSTNYNRPDVNSWYGINQYLLYKINDCWSFGGRMEWFRDDDGVRVTTSTNDLSGIAGFAGNFYELTAGINYKPHSNFLIRPELRYDWYQGPEGTSLVRLPYNDGDSSTQFSGGCDVIFTY